MGCVDLWTLRKQANVIKKNGCLFCGGDLREGKGEHFGAKIGRAPVTRVESERFHQKVRASAERPSCGA